MPQNTHNIFTEHASVSVVIPSWNGIALLGPCLDGVARMTSNDVRVIVVDDGSDDDSAGWLARHYPYVTVVKQPVRRGFAAAVNAGILACSTPYIALLNNDAIPESLWIETSIQTLNLFPAYAACVPKIVYIDDPSIINSLGIYLKWYGASGDIGIGEPDDGRFGSYAEVFGFTGCAVVFRREAVSAVGLFDEWLEAYGEDLDWTLRARAQGLRFVFCPAARVHHRGGASFGRRSARAIFLQSRNGVVVLAKHLPLSSLVRNGAGLAAFSVYQVLVNAMRGLGFAALSGKVHGLWHASQQRRAFKAVAGSIPTVGGCSDPLHTGAAIRPIVLHHRSD